MRYDGTAANWSVAYSKVLSQAEIDAILAALVEKAKDSAQAMVKLVIFRLSAFCGLRVSEICGLNMADVCLESDMPVIRIRMEIAKGKKAREVPIFSEAAVAECRRWKALRQLQGATADSPFVCSVSAGSVGNRFNRQGCRNRFKAACSALGSERASTLTIHHGRHTAASQSLAKGVPLPLVRDMLGHSSISITNTYASLFRSGKRLQYSLD
jgi:integrase/recombinase XerD